MKRLSCGIEDLDKKLQGGFPEGECILITGEPGTGKSIFGIQFLHKMCTEGRKCMMVATEEGPEKIVLHGKELGFDLEPFINKGQLSMIHYLEMKAFDIENNNVNMYTNIDDLNNLIHISEESIEVVVVDNLGTLSIGTELKQFKDKIDILSYMLSKQKRTSLIMMDATAHELTHRIAEYSTYGTIRLMTKENPYRGKIERVMHIPKMRGTKISLELINYDITENGIKILVPKTNK